MSWLPGMFLCLLWWSPDSNLLSEMATETKLNQNSLLSLPSSSCQSYSGSGQPFKWPKTQTWFLSCRSWCHLRSCQSNGLQINNKELQWLDETRFCSTNVLIFGSSADSIENLDIWGQFKVRIRVCNAFFYVRKLEDCIAFWLPQEEIIVKFYHYLNEFQNVYRASVMTVLPLYTYYHIVTNLWQIGRWEDITC